MSRALLAIALLAGAARIASLAVVSQPGYTDAYYYAVVAERLASGQGLTVDFVWSYLEAPALDPLPAVSHRFWMPLTTLLEALGILALGPWLGAFRAGQLVLVLFAFAIPPLVYMLARRLGGGERASLLAAAVVGAGGLFAPAWVSADSFAPAAALGSAFFLAYPKAAGGSARFGLVCGVLVGLLFLARVEAALFGLPLLLLLRRRASRRAAFAAVTVAVAIGLAWIARGFASGPVGDALARTLLLARYEDFFALHPSTDGLGDLGAFLGLRAVALRENALTAAMTLLLVLVPALLVGTRRLWASPQVRALAMTGVAIYLFQCLVAAPHSIRGSYFHSLAALWPFAVAVAVIGGAAWLEARRASVAGVAGVAGVAIVLGFVAVGALAVVQWDSAFNATYRARRELLPSIPEGPFLALDAAAWRWISGRTVFVTPADGLEAADCVARVYGARSMVLEQARLSAYAAYEPRDETLIFPMPSSAAPGSGECPR